MSEAYSVGAIPYGHGKFIVARYYDGERGCGRIEVVGVAEREHVLEVWNTDGSLGNLSALERGLNEKEIGRSFRKLFGVKNRKGLIFNYQEALQGGS